MSDLVAWIRAQLDATEAAAKAVNPSPDLFPYDPIEFILSNNDLSTPDIEAAERHIALHDPAAVLADVAAKRAILDEHYGEHECRICSDRIPDELRAPGGDLWLRREPVPCKTVRLLAEGFRGRDGYEEAMRDE